jgi:hypothetical protein
MTVLSCGVCDLRHEIIVVFDGFQSEHCLQSSLRGFISVHQDVVHVVDDAVDIGTAVLWHTILDRVEVLPL